MNKLLKFILITSACTLALSACGQGRQGATGSPATNPQATGTPATAAADENQEDNYILREDGYKLYNLQEMDAGEYPNIIGRRSYKDGNKRGQINILIRDSQNHFLEVSDNCTDKTGKSGTPDRGYLGGHLFTYAESEDAGEDIMFSWMEDVGTWLPFYKYDSSLAKITSSEESLKTATTEDEGKTGLTAEHLKNRLSQLASETGGTCDIKVYFYDSTEKLQVLFAAMYENGRMVGWYCECKAGKGDIGTNRCTVEFDTEKIAINLVDSEWNGSFMATRFGKY